MFPDHDRATENQKQNRHMHEIKHKYNQKTSKRTRIEYIL